MTKESPKILIVDDDEDVLLAAKLLLKRNDYQVFIEKNPQKIPFLLNNDRYDVILLDMNFSMDTTSGKEGFHWLQNILETDPNAVVILITAFGDVEMAVKALKEGATDFVLKPWQNEKFLATIASAVKLKRSYKEVDVLRASRKQLDQDMDREKGNLLGESQAMKSVFAMIDKVAKTDANVLILGENGTGKELVARAIHRQSNRADHVFVSVDMGAVSETLFESELFGHKKGSFTDAKEDRAGRFEAAHRGSLFLDEIGNLSSGLQSKLLTVLQNRTVTRLGTNTPVPIDIRLICATNMPLYKMVEENKFRQDLLYRINTVEIKLPPLRERAEDISMLVEHFIRNYCNKYRKLLKKLAPATLKKLERYPWPGNIRELQHAIERAVIMSDDQILRPDDFLFSMPQTDRVNTEIFNLDDVEKNVIQKVINRHGGNISKAAKELGLTRAALYRRLEKYGL